MQPCPEFEERILEYNELPPAARAVVDGHFASCDSCLEFSRALSDVDGELERAFVDVRLGSIGAAVLRKTQTPPEPPSWLPEVLDFAGWTSVAAVSLALITRLLPIQEPALWLALGAVVAGGSGWFGLRNWRELK
jgi:hypothetical protein